MTGPVVLHGFWAEVSAPKSTTAATAVKKRTNRFMRKRLMTTEPCKTQKVQPGGRFCIY